MTVVPCPDMGLTYGMAHLQEERGLVRDVGKAIPDVVDALLEALELEPDPVDLAHGPVLVLLLEPQEVDDRVERVVRLWAMEKYLLAMDELVASREAGEGLKVEDLPLPEGFVSACGKAYNLIGLIFMAEEVLGCWVFRTTRELTISGPVGVVISTGELVHFHIPALMSSSGAGGKHAKQIESIVGYPRDTILEELCDENSRRPIYRIPNEFRE